LTLATEPSSLTSLKLERRASAAECPFDPVCLWVNWTPLRDLPVMVQVYLSNGIPKGGKAAFG
jgi:hypothetical protein